MGENHVANIFVKKRHFAAEGITETCKEPSNRKKWHSKIKYRNMNEQKIR
jgi:hypothetical protein